MFADPPRGLLGVWECSGYESIECDFKTALDALEYRTFIEETDWDAIWKAECEASQSTQAQ